VAFGHPVPCAMRMHPAFVCVYRSVVNVLRSSPTVSGRPPCLRSVVGGATGVRTPNLRRARAALSRLSYGPRWARAPACLPAGRQSAVDSPRPVVVGAPGLEPGASALSGPRSDRLSYAPPPPRRARGHRGRWGVGGRDDSSSRGSALLAGGSGTRRPRGPPADARAPHGPGRVVAEALIARRP
jgi:hypothetical protein